MCFVLFISRGRMALSINIRNGTVALTVVFAGCAGEYECS